LGEELNLLCNYVEIADAKFAGLTSLLLTRCKLSEAGG